MREQPLSFKRAATRRILSRDLRLAKHANRILQQTLAKERSAVLRALPNLDRAADAIQSDPWREALTRVWAAAEKVVWEDTIRRLGENPKDHPPDLSDFDQLIEQRAKQIASDHRRQLYETLPIVKGLKAPSLRSVARALYDRFRSRTARRAITESLQAVAAVQHAAARVVARATGAVIVKVWVTVGDDRVRPSHRAASGQSRKLDEPFQLAGGQVDYPRDPNGPFDEIVNCRCWTRQERVI